MAEKGSKRGLGLGRGSGVVVECAVANDNIIIIIIICQLFVCAYLSLLLNKLERLLARLSYIE